MMDKTPAWTSDQLLLGLILSSIVFGVLVYQRRSEKYARRLPPGPRPMPIIGNILDFPSGFEAKHWAAHKALYGPISSLQAFGKTFVIINDVNIAIDLLEKRSVKHADRPKSLFAGKLCGFDSAFSMQAPGDQWRSSRRRVHKAIGTRSALSRYHDLFELEGRRLALAILGSPEKYTDHLRTYAGAIILDICFGYSVSRRGGDPLVALGKQAMDVFEQAVGHLWLVDLIPFLQYLPDWLPGMQFKKLARHYHDVLFEFMDRPFKFVQSQLAKGSAPTSFVSTELEGSSGTVEEEEEIRWTTATVYAGASDTSVAVMQTFVLAMTLHPEVARRAQDEIIAAIGTDRLPQLADRPRLPYLEAVLKETLRWNVAAPLSLPRASCEDDEYCGYFIPKGAVIFPNIWQMFHDPDVYQDPFLFKPERFLSGEVREPEPDPRAIVFGFGRRICPGKELADASLYVACSMVLALFDITKARDQFGKIIEPEVEYQPGFVSHPKKFDCTIRPRSDAAVTLIKSVLSERAFDKDNSGDLPKSNL